MDSLYREIQAWEGRQFQQCWGREVKAGDTLCDSAMYGVGHESHIDTVLSLEPYATRILPGKTGRLAKMARSRFPKIIWDDDVVPLLVTDAAQRRQEAQP